MLQTLDRREVSREPGPALDDRNAKLFHPARFDFLLPFLVLAGATVLAVFLYLQFLELARFRWDSVIHDRNAHYLFSLSLVHDVRSLSFKQLLVDLDSARVWPPLHDMLAALAMLIGGPDYRVAVLPSMAGWIGMLVLGFLLARRMLHRGGTLAGLTAVLFLAASPAHRAYAPDAMLESLGACLSLLVLYLYLAAAQNPTVWSWRRLGLALTVLFLFKFNYWFLAAAALTAAEWSKQPGEYCRAAFRTLRAIDYLAWLRVQARQPLNYLLVLILAGIAFIIIGGGQSFRAGGMTVSVNTPHNLIHLAYAVLFLRLALWWRRERQWTARLAPGARQILFWHGLPVAIWFLLPKRLGHWLWYMNPATNVGEVPQYQVTEGIGYYWQILVGDYHLGFWSACVAVALGLLAVFARRRLRPGSRAVVWLVLIALLLTVPHPNRKSRFLHSWLPAVWVLSGVGLAGLVYTRRRYQPQLRPWLGAVALVGLAVSQAPGMLSAGHASERGFGKPVASARDLSDYYLPFVAKSRHTAIFATVEMKHLARWSVLEAQGRRDRLETEPKALGATPEENRKSFDNWLHATLADTLIFVDLPPGSYFHETTNVNEAHARLRGFLTEQSLFRLHERREFPRYGCSVSVWLRDEGK